MPNMHKTHTPTAASQDMLEFASKETIRPLTVAVQPAKSETPDFAPAPVTEGIRTTPTKLAIATITSPVAVTAQTSARRHRGANPAMDNIWTRHHAICTMGVLCDVALGGYDAARAASAPLKQGVRPAAVVNAIRASSPWLANPDYLSFRYCATFIKRGLHDYFKLWVTNRVNYFYKYPERSQHPVNLKEPNLSAVYTDFYATFGEDLATHSSITEERAIEFWKSVSDRVQFRSPVINPAVEVPPPKCNLDLSSKLLLTRYEAALALGVCEKSIQRMEARGLITSLKVLRTKLYTRESLLKFIEEVK